MDVDQSLSQGIFSHQNLYSKNGYKKCLVRIEKTVFNESLT